MPSQSQAQSRAKSQSRAQSQSQNEQMEERKLDYVGQIAAKDAEIAAKDAEIAELRELLNRSWEREEKIESGVEYWMGEYDNARADARDYRHQRNRARSDARYYRRQRNRARAHARHYREQRNEARENHAIARADAVWYENAYNESMDKLNENGNENENNSSTKPKLKN